MSDALSEWDKLRLEKAILAFRARIGSLNDAAQMNVAMMAALQAADLVKPPSEFGVLPLPPAPERYNSLGEPLLNPAGGHAPERHGEVVEEANQAG